MKNIALLLLLPAALIACGTDCDKAGDQISAKYDTCGIETTEAEESEAEEECTDADGVAALCIADCVDAADCTVLDGSADPMGEEMASYSECVTGCA